MLYGSDLTEPPCGLDGVPEDERPVVLCLWCEKEPADVNGWCSQACFQAHYDAEQQS